MSELKSFSHRHKKYMVVVDDKTILKTDDFNEAVQCLQENLDEGNLSSKILNLEEISRQNLEALK